MIEKSGTGGRRGREGAPNSAAVDSNTFMGSSMSYMHGGDVTNIDMMSTCWGAEMNAVSVEYLCHIQ